MLKVAEDFGRARARPSPRRWAAASACSPGSAATATRLDVPLDFADGRTFLGPVPHRPRAAPDRALSAMIPSQRALFDLPREVAYLNCAYMSPLLTEAVEIGRAALARKARPWTIRPADFFSDTERARALFARLIGADAAGVALVPAASYGIATAVANLPLARRPDDRARRRPVPLERPPLDRRAPPLPAPSVVTATPGPDGDLTAALLAAIDERTAIVACAQCRWTDGALVDLVRVGAAARAVGAALVLDLTQSCGALPIDLAAVRPDFLVAAAYKWLLGPYSTGFLWIAPQHRDGRPLEQHWLGREGAEDFTRLVDYPDAYAPGARRFDMGEAPNFALLPVACAALERADRLGRRRDPGDARRPHRRHRRPRRAARPRPPRTRRCAPAISSACAFPARPAARPARTPRRRPACTSACAAPACASRRISTTTTRTSTACSPRWKPRWPRAANKERPAGPGRSRRAT